MSKLIHSLNSIHATLEAPVPTPNREHYEGVGLVSVALMIVAVYVGAPLTLVAIAIGNRVADAAGLAAIAMISMSVVIVAILMATSRSRVGHPSSDSLVSPR
jgi:ABC-type enterochelin transport system permease subunit